MTETKGIVKKTASQKNIKRARLDRLKKTASRRAYYVV